MIAPCSQSLMHNPCTGQFAMCPHTSGSIFTALEIINTTKYGVWAKSPSGYICIKGSSGREYCKKV